MVTESLRTFVISLLAGCGMIAVGLAPLAAWTRRHRTGLAVPALGALAWVVTVAAKAAWAIPTNAAVKNALLSALGPRGIFVMEIYIGLLTGVTEVGLLLLLTRVITRLRRVSWDEAVAFGLGFGGVEAVLLGLAVVLVHGAHEPALALAGVLERASAMVFHVVACVLVLRGAPRLSRRGAFLVAFVYKSAIDAFAAWGILSFGVKTRFGSLLVFEIAIALFAIASMFLFSTRARKIDAVV